MSVKIVSKNTCFLLKESYTEKILIKKVVLKIILKKKVNLYKSYFEKES